METVQTCHPWVASLRDRVTFSLQPVAEDGTPVPGAQLKRIARTAEQLGFEALWLSDHPARGPEPWVHLAALAGVTTRIRLGPMVAAVPYRPPLLTARLASDVDHLSDGRLVLGLGIGWNAAEWGLGSNEFDRMGLPYPATPARQAALEEAIAIIRGVWGEQPFTFRGEHYQVADARVAPPRQRPAPPLVIAGSGRRTLDQVARLADMANFGPGPSGGVITPDDARVKLALLRTQCAAHDRAYADILRSYFIQWLILAPDESRLLAKVAQAFPEGLTGLWADIVIPRTPEAAIAYFQGFADAGIQHFVVQFFDPRDEETLDLLVQRVIPAVRPGPA